MVRKAKRRFFDPALLPHADQARVVSDIVDFFTDRLPTFVAREFDNYDLAWAEAELFRALAALPDRRLKKLGLDRADLPAFVLSTFHLIRVSEKRRKGGRRASVARKRPAKRRLSKRRARAA